MPEPRKSSTASTLPPLASAVGLPTEERIIKGLASSEESTISFEQSKREWDAAHELGIQLLNRSVTRSVRVMRTLPLASQQQHYSACRTGLPTGLQHSRPAHWLRMGIWRWNLGQLRGSIDTSGRRRQPVTVRLRPNCQVIADFVAVMSELQVLLSLGQATS